MVSSWSRVGEGEDRGREELSMSLIADGLRKLLEG